MTTVITRGISEFVILWIFSRPKNPNYDLSTCWTPESMSSKTGDREELDAVSFWNAEINDDTSTAISEMESGFSIIFQNVITDAQFISGRDLSSGRERVILDKNA